MQKNISKITKYIYKKMEQKVDSKEKQERKFCGWKR